MCGIVGRYSFNDNVSFDQIKRMSDKLINRGPDAEGFFVEKNVGLGHRRLSIIDLESGDQPIFNESKTIVIVFNGEIYNFQSLKSDLLDKGHEFYTNSDTEVIVHGYEEYGIDFILQKLEGMFAFALYDKNLDKLFVGRDKFGEKPLYFYKNSNDILFASELKALESEIPSKQICPMGLNYFFAMTYIPAPHSIYKGVCKLLPGHYLDISSENALQKPYFEIPISPSRPMITDLEEAKQEIRKLLTESVKARMVADVPIGTFLSGGIDSSIISAIMSKLSPSPIKTFSIGFKEKDFDESDRAELVAQHIGSDHSLFILDYKEAANVVDEVILNYDEPFGDASAISAYFVAKLAREKVKVVLTGDCADELFGGYEKYLAPHYKNLYCSLPRVVQNLIKHVVRLTPHTSLTNIILRKAKKVINNSSLDNFSIGYNLMSLGFNDLERKELLINDYSPEIRDEVKTHYDFLSEANNLDRQLYTDLKVVIEGCMLPKVDRACMKTSLEARVPFLDSSVVEFSQRLPSSFKIDQRNKKVILKEAFKDLLPEKVFNFSKRGFGLPVDRWFRGELKEELRELINKKALEKQGIFNHELLNRLFEEHVSKKEDHRFKLWTIFVFQKWYKKTFK